MSSINLHISGDTVEAVQKQLLGFAALAGGSALATFETEALLHELRDRMAKNSLVVKIVPFTDENSSGNSGEPVVTTDKPKRGRPKATDKPAETNAGGTTAGTAERPKSDPVQTIAEAAGATVPEQKTIDDVKASLNAFAALLGQVEARKIMQEAGGSPALKDVPTEKYGALIAKLDERRKEAEATNRQAA